MEGSPAIVAFALCAEVKAKLSLVAVECLLP